MCCCCCKAALFGGIWLCHSVIFSISNICSKSSSLSLSLSLAGFAVCFVTPCECRWTASFWPLKISKQAESLRQQHQEDEDRFRKNHVLDQNSFQHKLEEMEVNKPLTINCLEKGALKLLWSVRWETFR